MIFGHRRGLPGWQDGGFDLPVPQLPMPKADNKMKSQGQVDRTEFHCALCLATANVLSLSKSPEGHGGKLHFLQQQMKFYKINCMAIQETRTPAERSCSHNILRFASGALKGQLGRELWINLDEPIGWANARHPGKPLRLHRNDFCVVFAGPRIDYLCAVIIRHVTYGYLPVMHLTVANLFQNDNNGGLKPPIFCKNTMILQPGFGFLTPMLHRVSQMRITVHRDGFAASLSTPLCSKAFLALIAEKPRVTPLVWQYRLQKLAHRKKGKELRKRIGLEALSLCFQTWSCQRAPAEEIAIFNYGTTLRCHQVKHFLGFRKSQHQFRLALTHAKQQLLQEQLDELRPETSASTLLRVLKPFIGPTNPKKAKPRTLPLLHGPDGRPCTLPTESSAIWIKFSQDMKADNARRKINCEPNGSINCISFNRMPFRSHWMRSQHSLILKLLSLDAALTMRFAKNTQHDTSKLLRLPQKMTMEVSKVLRLPRKMKRIFSKRRKRIAPATPNNFRHFFQTRENVTKCHACHTKRRYNLFANLQKTRGFGAFPSGTATPQESQGIETRHVGMLKTSLSYEASAHLK
eukprot:s5028_g4.t1